MYLCHEKSEPVAQRPVLAPLRWIGATAPLDRCLFVDRDGVINERRIGGYVTTWSDFVWRPDAIATLKHAVDDACLPLVIVTNQACIGRGLVDTQAVLDVQERMREELRAAGVPLAAWYCCPHQPSDGCACRKPLPGMLEACHSDLGVDLRRSYLIGDSRSDVAAGEAVGCTSWRIDTPQEFMRAVDLIIAHERTSEN